MGTELINKLKAEGWQQQFSASGERLKEAIDNYTWLGFEVKTVALGELGCDGCTACFDDESGESMMIFTRKVNAGQDNELFPNDN